MEEGESFVSFSRIMSIFSWSASERSSFCLWIIPLEFQNRIFKLSILGRKYSYESSNSRFYECFGVSWLFDRAVRRLVSRFNIIVILNCCCGWVDGEDGATAPEAAEAYVRVTFCGGGGGDRREGGVCCRGFGLAEF